MFKKKDFPILLIMIFFFGFIASFLPPGYSHYYQYLLFPMIFIILYFSKYFNWKIIFYVLFISIGIAVYISSFQYPNYCIKTEFLDWQFQDICSIDDQLRYVNYVSSYSNDLLYLYNWEPYLGWLSEKKIAAFTVGCNEVLSNYYKPSLNYSNSELLYIIYQDYIRMCGNLKFKEKINDWNFIPIDNNFGIIKN